jgi:hypothetical protein
MSAPLLHGDPAAAVQRRSSRTPSSAITGT